jgi:hypothetical protein
LAFPFVLPFAGFISPINIQCHTVTFWTRKWVWSSHDRKFSVNFILVWGTHWLTNCAISVWGICILIEECDIFMWSTCRLVECDGFIWGICRLAWDFLCEATFGWQCDVPMWGSYRLTECNIWAWGRCLLTNFAVLLVGATGEAVPPSVVIPVDLTASEKAPDNVTTALLDKGFVASPRRYPISEFTQFWIVLKRTLLFSRRDWVRLCHMLLTGTCCSH